VEALWDRGPIFRVNERQQAHCDETDMINSVLPTIRVDSAADSLA